MSRPNAPGFLLVIEGIDGAGKSTLLAALAEELRRRGHTCVTSREPTQGPHGRALRESARAGRLSLEDELELFLKDRAQHVAELIKPALSRGEVVLLDRYYLSTAAYQGARGADPAAIIARNESFAPVPDLVLLLDLDPADGAGRIRARGDEPDDFEALDYQRAVRQMFLFLNLPYLRRINASQPPEAVLADSIAALDAALNPSL